MQKRRFGILSSNICSFSQKKSKISEKTSMPTVSGATRRDYSAILSWLKTTSDLMSRNMTVNIILLCSCALQVGRVWSGWHLHWSLKEPSSSNSCTRWQLPVHSCLSSFWASCFEPPNHWPHLALVRKVSQTLTYVSIHQHTSEYTSIRPHTSKYTRFVAGCKCVLLPLKLSVDQSNRPYDLKKHL